MKCLRIFLIPVVGLLFGSCFNKISEPAASQFTKDTTAIASFLALKFIPATEFPAGVWFTIDSAAEGIRPTFKDSIKLKYTTKLLADNSIIGQSTTAQHFRLDSLLTAIQIVLGEFQSGSKGTIFLPSDYTTNGNWIFQFQLTDVKDYQLKLDNTIIDNYLSAHSINNAVRDASGLRYTMDSLKVGSNVTLRDEVLVNYTAKTMSDGIIIDHGNSVRLQLSNIILGWRIGLRKMTEGSTFTLYVPSSLAYGSGSTSSIKPNSNLIFNITLLKVIHH